MNKTELITAVAQEAEMTKKDAEKAVKAVIDVVSGALAKGEKVSYEEVLENVKKRDFIDSTREESPLRKADDAIVLDNSNMSRAEQKAWLREKFEACVKE